MTAIYCQKCESQTVNAIKCRRCGGLGRKSGAPMGVYCRKCKGQGSVKQTSVVKTEMLFVRAFNDSEAKHWQCPKCGYRLYLPKVGTTSAPEVQLPLLDPISIKEMKPDKEVLVDYIKRRFG